MREEDLLGYLLNAVDAAERRRIEEALRADPALRQQLKELRERLSALDSPAEDYEPPEDLLEQTCNLVEGCQQQRTRRQPLPPVEPGPAARSWSLRDLTTAAGLVVAVSMLFFPAIANSRYHTHVRACQHNLQQLGMALCQFSDLDPRRAFPQIPLSGNRAAAGIYAPILLEGGFLSDTRNLICPSSQLAEERAGWRVPALVELDRARDRPLEQMQAVMGGSYGYTLGYQVGDRYYAPRNEGRSFFALMSDAPSLHLVGRRSSNHCGLGQNVVFEDLHIEFIVGSEEPTEFAILRNALFVNRHGFAEAGADKNDYVIGRSEAPPLLLTADAPPAD